MYTDKEMPEMPGTLEPLYMEEPAFLTEGRKRREALLGEPRIFADLMKGGGGHYILTCMGTRWDLRHYGMILKEGMFVRFFEDDEEDDPLLFEGHVHFDAENKYWVALLDPDNIRHFSDDKKNDL